MAMAPDDSPADLHRRFLPRTPPPDASGTKRHDIPPFYPHFPTPPSPGTGGQHHTRSLSQPALFSFDALPPLGPAPPPASSSLSDPIAGADAAVDDSAGSAPSFAARPPRKTHRRSASDMSSSFSSADALSGSLPALVKSEGEGIGDDLFAAFFNLDFINSGNFLENRDDMDSGASGTKHNREDSSDNEVESSMEVSDGSLEKKGSQKRSFRAVGGPRHSRSVSVDSFMGNLPNFSDELLRLPPSPSPGVVSGQHSRSNSFDGSSNLFGIEQGSGDFSGPEMKKIMANEKLAEIAASDPKRAKRILANRQSAARSKERKMRYISELENKVQTLQTEATTLSTQLTMLQRDSAGLNSQNNELRFRLQSMEQQAQLRNALNEALTSEVRHLKLAAQDISTSTSNNRLGQQMHVHSQLYPMRQQPMQPFYQFQQQQLSQTPQEQEQLKQHREQSQQHPNSLATMREQDK